MMTTKLKYLYALIFVISINTFMYAEKKCKGRYVIIDGEEVCVPDDPDSEDEWDENNGTPPEAEGTRYNPIDMHTSALLVAGVGLIASYAYFARRRQENI